MGWRYRIWQLRQLLAAEALSAETTQAIQAILSPAEWQLFLRLRPSDQWHSYRVLTLLQQAGQTQPGLLTAALLHDVGKTCVRLSVADRCLIVLATKLWPKRARRWGNALPMTPDPAWLTSRPFGWRTPFVVKAQHPAWSAALAAEAGSAPDAVALIRQHQVEEIDSAESHLLPLLRRLQWADDQS